MGSRFFECEMHKCFRNGNGRCTLLLEPCERHECPFKKTSARVAAENLKVMERLVSLHREDLAELYNSSSFM